MGMTPEEAFAQALGAAKSFTKKALKGAGALKGEDGKSAYEIAVENGFEGTEEEWLESLQGPPGEPGEPGESYDDTEIKVDINDVWKAQGELGAKNLIPYPYPYPTPYTLSEITVTESDDGGLVLNGTQTSYFWFHLAANYILKKGSYILSTTEILPQNLYLQVLKTSDGNAITTIGNAGRSKSVFTIAEDTMIQIRIVATTAGTTFDNYTVYPMLRLASDTDDTWQPYTMTNKELTKEIQDIQDKTPYVTPEMFGAVGDGVTNDLAAFQAALLQNKPIRLDSKHYLIDGDLYITKPNTIIEGKIGAYSSTSPRLKFINQHGLRIEDSIFSASFKNFAIFSDGVGLTMQSATNRMGNIVFEGLYFKCRRDVLIDTETGYVYFKKCHFDFDPNTTFDGDLVKLAYTGTGTNRVNYVSFNQCEFEGQNIPNHLTDANCYLIHLDNCSNINITASDICNCFNAIKFGSTGASQYITLTNNYLWNIKTIANIGPCLYFNMTGNSQYTPSGCQPIIFPSNQRGHVITGNIFSIGSWAVVSVENLYTIFANNYIKGTLSDEVLSRLHIKDNEGGSFSGGTAGKDGKSAYQIAVDNGYSGTEQQWLDSLKGPKGDKGDSGTSSNASSIPKVFLTGNVDGLSKQNPKDVSLEYKDGANSFSATANIKWQGNSSLSYPKKNFTVKLYEDETKAKKKKVDVGFGSQSKYVLKANYIDHSHARNIVCARLWGDIVASRPNQEEIPTELLNSPNKGAVDGFPIKLYLNGVYQGLYTWNIPKDAWMTGMDSDNPNHAILCAEGNNDGSMSVNYSTQFRRTTNFKADTVGEWTIEFPDEDAFSNSLKTSFNNLLTFVSTSSDEDFVANLSNYANVQSLIDYYIFAYLVCGLDMLGKNMLMFTYDGVHWFASAYDLDSTFGLWWNGSKFVAATYKCPEDYQENNSLLWQRMENLFTDAIKERYFELRSSVLSVPNVIYRFEEFTDLISQDLYNEDTQVYSGIPSASTNNIRQIRNYYNQRCTYVDGEMQTLGIITLSSISATKTIQQYNVGDTVDTSDIQVTANYSDGTSKDVTSSSVIDASAVDTSKKGTYSISISYTEDDVTVTTTCSITVTNSSEEPVVEDDASFTPTLSCIHTVAFNPNDLDDRDVFKDYLIYRTSSHTYLVTTPNSLPIYTDDTRKTIAGYAIPVPAAAEKVNMQATNTKLSFYFRFVDSDLQFIGEEIPFLSAQSGSYELSELSKRPKWIVFSAAGSSNTSANAATLTFE